MNWIKISDRMPSEEENNSLNLVWWMPTKQCFIEGRKEGSYICNQGAHRDLEEFTHWAIVEGPKE